ncbi:MAG: hypothetical protein WDM70_07960 [Nitrosomonadales bacterium]
MLTRADLDKEKRQQALFELGQDYLKAGILDRAETLFQDLQGTPYAKPALDFLLEVIPKGKGLAQGDWGDTAFVRNFRGATQQGGRVLLL